LTDYKVLILTLNENDVPPAVQKMITDKESEINTDDASKLIGCINALSKQILGDEGIIKETDLLSNGCAIGCLCCWLHQQFMQFNVLYFCY